MIIDSDAKKFQELFKKETGDEISLEEASECVESLVEMIKLIYKPIKRDDSKKCTSGETGI